MKREEEVDLGGRVEEGGAGSKRLVVSEVQVARRWCWERSRMMGEVKDTHTSWPRRVC